MPSAPGNSWPGMMKPTRKPAAMPASTGFGRGVAVPHVKHPLIKKLAGTMGHSSAGVDFAALDKQPVYTVVLLLSPDDQPEQHLAAMNIIFTSLQDDMFRRFIRQAQD